MRSIKTIATIVAGSLAAASHGAFVGFSIEAGTVLQGAETYYTYKVFARFNNANDTVLNAFGMNGLSAGDFWHNDFLSGPDGSNVAGTWSPALIPSPTAAVLDSWVTIGGNAADFGNSTSADPGWGAAGWNQAGVPANAGWFNQNPPNLQGRVNPSTLQTIIAQFVFKNTLSLFCTPITIGYNAGLGTSTQFGQGWIICPAPSAVALLGLAGLSGRRRR